MIERLREFFEPHLKEDSILQEYSLGYRDALCHENKRISGVIEAMIEIIRCAEEVKKYWDISDPANVRPAVETVFEGLGLKQEIRNDSMAAGSITMLVNALNKFEEMTKSDENNDNG